MTPRDTATGITVAALLSAGILGGIGSAAAQPDDYVSLLIDPNIVVDTLAYTAGPPSMNPGGQPGATVIYSHRDGRSITDTVWVLADPAAATAAIAQAQSTSGITNPVSEPVAVGSGGRLLKGMSADSKALGILYFTEGNAASAIEFSGPANDPVPTDFAIELGQAQDALIKSRLGS